MSVACIDSQTASCFMTACVCADHGAQRTLCARLHEKAKCCKQVCRQVTCLGSGHPSLPGLVSLVFDAKKDLRVACCPREQDGRRLHQLSQWWPQPNSWFLARPCAERQGGRRSAMAVRAEEVERNCHAVSGLTHAQPPPRPSAHTPPPAHAPARPTARPTARHTA